MTRVLLPFSQTRRLTDSVGWLTLYLGLLLFLPSRLILGPLGSAGAPSMLFGLGSLFLWLLTFVGAARRAASEPQPIRIALGILLFCVGVSYVFAMTRPLSPDETSPADVALLALASWAGTLLLTHDGINDRRRLDTLIWRFAVCGGLIAALGLVQIATRQLVGGSALDPRPHQRDAAYSLSTRGGYPRPAGTAIHPIEYGVILAMILPHRAPRRLPSHAPRAGGAVAASSRARCHHSSDLVAIGVPRRDRRPGGLHGRMVTRATDCTSLR